MKLFKKGQISLEIGILILVAVVCSAIGGYYFSLNVADSGSDAGGSANTVTSTLNPKNSGTVDNINNLIFSEISGGSASEITQLQYWIENTSKVWTKTNLSMGENTIYITLNNGYSSNGDNVFPFFDDFSESELNNTKWNVENLTTTIIDGELYLAGIDGHDGTIESNSLGILADNYIIESRVYMIKQSIIMQVSDSKSNDRNVIMFDRDGLGYDDWTGSCGGDQANLAGRLSLNTYSDIKLVPHINGTIDIYRNYASMQTRNIYNTYDTIGLGIVNYGLGTGKFDYIFTRKYVENEPTIESIELVDENTIKCTINSQSDLENYQIAVNISDLSISNTDELLNIYSN